MKIYIAKKNTDIADSFLIMAQLRTNLEKKEYIQRVKRQQKNGFMLAIVKDGDNIVAVSGFRILENLAYGKFLYIDDLITDEKKRSKGYGDKLFDFLYDLAKREKCTSLQLDSGVQRFDAHRFYLRKRMSISAHHFSCQLS